MDGLTAMPRNYEPRVAKKIFLHRNGVDNTRPKVLVINERQIRDFTTFLNRATSGIRAPVAVRNIYTPKGGSKVLSLQDIQNGKHYVAGGNEHFKKLKYESMYAKPLNTTRPLVTNKWSPVRTTAIKATSRFRDLPEKPYLIHVFRNGDALFHGVRVLLPKRIMNSMEHILELVTEKADLTLPAKRLCNLEGQTIHAVTDIKDGEKYVAIEGSRKFVRLPYTAIDPTPRNIRYLRLKRLTKEPATPPIVPDKPKQIKRLMPPKQHKGKNRPFAGRKDIEARNLALSDARADSVFGGSPIRDDDVEPLPKLVKETRVKKQSTPDPVPPTVHDSSVEVDIIQPTNEIVEETTTNEEDETVDEIVDEKVEAITETKVETSLEEHAEIHEEVVEEKDGEKTEKETPPQKQEDLVEMQGETAHTTVDLSVARVQSTNEEDNNNSDLNANSTSKVNKTENNSAVSSATKLQDETAQV